jgi:Heparinase II/III N-terminus/Heparinase II/III-like protein
VGSAHGKNHRGAEGEVPVRLTEYVRKAATLPPRVVLRKASEKARRGMTSWYRVRRDKHLATYSRRFASHPPVLPSLFRAVPPDGLKSRAKMLATLADHYMNHRFDLLGSGWVQVRHGMECTGLEGHRYPAGRPARVDPRGGWLADRVTPPNLPGAGRVWSLVDEGYVPIDWHLDFKSGYRWDERIWYRDIPYGHLPGVDIKVPRELARMQHLPHLAWAFALSREFQPGSPSADAYAREFRNQVLDFTAANPPRFGVNWACTMDVAIRVANWIASFDLFRAAGARFDDRFTAEFASAVFDHAAHIVGNLEWFVELRSNHYLSDIVGLLFAAAFLPGERLTDAWLAFGAQELARETEGQFHTEGTNFEASTSYHRLSSELVLYGTALLLGLPEKKRNAWREYDRRLIGVPPGLGPAPLPLYRIPGNGLHVPFPPEHFERLEKMGEFTIDVTKPDGRIAQIGDNDSGRLFKLDPSFLPNDAEGVPLRENVLDHRHLVAGINGFFDRADFSAFAGDANLETAVVRGLSGGALFPSCRQRGITHEAVAVRVGTEGDRRRIVALHRNLPDGKRAIYEIASPGDDLLAGMTISGYPGYGLYLFRSLRLYLAVRCGSIGQNGNGGHAHNDQLSLVMNVDGEDWIVDPGTYLYTALPARRNEYRSVKAHFAPRTADGREPGRLDLGLFLLGDEAEAQCLYFGEDGFIGVHWGFGEPIYRMVELSREGVRVVDFTEGSVPLQVLAYSAGRTPRNVQSPPFSPGYGDRHG